MTKILKGLLSTVLTVLGCACFIFIMHWLYSILLGLGWLWLLALIFFPILTIPINALPAVFVPVYLFIGKNKIINYINSVIMAATGVYLLAAPFLIEEHFTFLQWIWTVGYWSLVVAVVSKGISVTLNIPYEDNQVE